MNMWKYMEHDSGLGLVRCDWDKEIYQSYHGNGVWADDEYGFVLWMGISSDNLHYTKVDEEQASRIMERIDAFIRKRSSAEKGGTSGNQTGIDLTGMYNGGTRHLKEHRIRPALDSLKKVVEADPSHVDAWHNLGVCYAYLGKYDDALDCFERVLAINPDSAATLSNKGIILIRKNEFDTAIPFIQDALKKKPGELALRISFINLLTALGRYEEAIQCRAEMPPVGGMTYMLLGSVSKEYRDMSTRIGNGEPVDKVKAEIHGEEQYEKPEDVKVIAPFILGYH